MSVPRRSPAASRAPAFAILTLADLERDGAAWDVLADRAVDLHPHYTRHTLSAHRRAGLAAADLRIVVVRSGARLDAVMPFRLTYDLCGLGRPVARPFASPFVTAALPLVADGPDLPATLAALAAGLRAASEGRPWRWPLLATDTRLGQALRAALKDEGWALGKVAAFARPILDRRASHDAFVAGHPNRARLKDLRRRQRRLSEAGSVTLEAATGGEPLRAAVDAFLALEKAGWKGAAGSAMACRGPHAAFARALFAEGGGPVGARADVLMRNGRPLAISLALVAGGTACLLKTAYDEAERAGAPGLVLEAEIVRALHETAFADRLDSATLAGSALESLYPERETIAEVVAVPAGGIVSLDRRIRLARFEHAARAEAKLCLAGRGVVQRLMGRR
ncbi:GNAT family N-acetyltransferase [Methylobacterium gossipiicola]|uniref:Acetyltransferase involved in cellulose biosynthesis, CelD/BcsL family n=1 Tax=Methylobacterium gossipiicola TaxID=582675 RepID=A0A1I2QG18_9HYPH|nr:GNAT family N-acetyltransferase [Methylobacterium gossipiicola]SFG26593.1 Acetyltransferase involved in cellulose biosynthesis, CelD/BcsL family [Methylobacterium gossipiicola]